MNTIYCISGLGADYRMFKNLNLPGFELIHLPWIRPEEDEPIEDYARRFSRLIDEDEATVIGMSFGGMLAVEISRHIALKKIILISSAKTKRDLPPYFGWTGILKLNKILPLRRMGQPSMMMEFLFGAKTKEEKALLGQIIRDTDPHFYNWASNQIIQWKNNQYPANLVHIHGTSDLVLPYMFVKKLDYTVRGGGHLMIINRAGEISTIVGNVLKQ